VFFLNRKLERINKIVDGVEVKFRVEVDETKLDKHLAQHFADLKYSLEDDEAQDIFKKQSAAEVVKQVTDALGAITFDKTRDVKIIIANDKINQEGFEIKLSYRLHDPV
jgi:hypothetical protein